MIYRTDEDPNWFYVIEGRRQGPLDRRGLVQALLALDVPEKTLVWRSGLNAWTRAGDLQELRIELPPPIPQEPGPLDQTPPPPLPTEDGTLSLNGAAGGKGADDDEDDEEADGETSSTDGAGAPGEGRRRRRRRRKRKHSEKSSHNPRVLELLALFLILALVLWFLLRRMNRVPEGTIIYQGLLHGVPEAVTPPPEPAA